MIADLNKYWTVVQPWTFAQSQKEQDIEKMKTVLCMSFEGIRIAALMLQPIMPDKMKILLDNLGIPQQERFYQHAILNGTSIANRVVLPMKPLFPKLE